MTALADVKVQRDPIVTKLDEGKRALQVWPLPLEEAFLEEFLTYIFKNYWDQIVFGPLIEGDQLRRAAFPSRHR
jgi:hypothetical protein